MRLKAIDITQRAGHFDELVKISFPAFITELRKWKI